MAFFLNIKQVINMIERSLAILFGVFVGWMGYLLATKKKITAIKENFLPSMTYKVDRVAAPNEDFAHKGEFWSVPGTYQSLVAPRSASVQYGSQIQYNLPPDSLLAYRSDTPFANEGLLTTGEGDDIVQPVTYDRFMFSNKKSRLRTHGDPIRGDLPIIPHNSDWFRPSVQPHIDLKEGAMQVMGGFDNDTNNQLSLLMAASAGNAMQTFGGMNFSGDDGLSSHMGAFMRSPVADSSFSSTAGNNTDVNLMKFMSAAPQGSNITQGFAATGMVPQYTNASNTGIFSSMGMVPQNTVTMERSGDINVMRG
ncbi:hypothetical protein DH26_gp088 [Chloriridovirus anopheles1]|uniref:Uncharacterized protein n=1 Tax=Chloriridovirus anopheles1 TaxID=1465751 RepID=W8R9P9_9VIRU|nr:hypothetical protein DH26_gp088 [Anopheles minimus iridovirus]AHL67581.1 hypothetical protein AMIV_088 [Anopheles minimus iridovirus]